MFQALTLRQARWSLGGLLLTCLLSGGAAPCWSAPALFYTITDLGDVIPEGLDLTSMTTVGQVGTLAAQLAPTFQILGALPGGQLSDAQSVSGPTIVGRSDGPDLTERAFRKQGTGPLEDLSPATTPTFPSMATDVNAAGTIVGVGSSLATSAFPLIWPGGTAPQPLPTLGGPSGFAWAINELGDVAGSAETTTPFVHHCAFWPVTGGIIDCQTIPDASTSTGVELNDRQQVVGEVVTSRGSQGFVWTPTAGMRELVPLPGDVRASALAVNDAGDIVGWSEQADGSRVVRLTAVVWVAFQPEPLLPRVLGGADWQFTRAVAINNQGVIAVEGTFQGRHRAALLLPAVGIPPVPPQPLVAQRSGDVNGDGVPDVVGLDAQFGIWRCLAGAAACEQLPGWLTALVVEDLDGDGRPDIAGIGGGNTIWAMLDGVHWHHIPGWLSSITAGDFYGDGHAHLAGIGWDQTIWRHPHGADLDAWEPIPGWGTVLVAGDFVGTGRVGLATLGIDNVVYLSQNAFTWQYGNGWLLKVAAVQGAQHQDLLGWNGQCWYRMPQFGGWQLHACNTDVAVQDGTVAP